jgi:hypothetical protein
MIRGSFVDTVQLSLVDAVRLSLVDGARLPLADEGVSVTGHWPLPHTFLDWVRLRNRSSTSCCSRRRWICR